MAVDSKKMMQAIYDSLYGAMTGSVPGFPVERSVPPNQAFLTMLTGGISVGPAAYANAYSPLNPDGSYAAARALAQLVEDAPALHPVHTRVGRVEDFYEEIVRAKVDPTPPNPTQDAALAAAEDYLFDAGIEYDEVTGEPKTVPNAVPSPAYRNYKNKFQLFEAALDSYLAEWGQVDQNSNTDKQRWAIKAPILQTKVRMAYAEYGTARPGVIREKESIISQASQSSLTRRFAEARELFELSPVSDPAHLELSGFRPVQAIPANWVTTTNLSNVEIKSTEMHTSTSSSWGSWGGSAGLDLGFFSIGGGGGGSWSNYNLSQETSDLVLSFKWSRVNILRPWLKENLFTCSGWDVEGRGKNAYSTGKVDKDNTGVFPLLPVAFVVVRDLSVTAKWSSADRQTMTRNVNGRGGVRIGPFSFGGGASSSSSSSSSNGYFDGTKITRTGAQVVAFLNRLMPACPPK